MRRVSVSVIQINAMQNTLDRMYKFYLILIKKLVPDAISGILRFQSDSLMTNQGRQILFCEKIR